MFRFELFTLTIKIYCHYNMHSLRQVASNDNNTGTGAVNIG